MACWLHIVIATAEAPEKCAPALERIWPDLEPDVSVSVLSGERPGAANALSQRFAGLHVHHHPGESVWHLRRRMGELLAGSEWMVLLEDHNLPLPDWLPSLMAELRRADKGSDMRADAIFGATCNQTSTGAWDWANYLAVLVFHWAPLNSPVVHPLIFNAAVRVDRLPPLPWALGTLEQAMPGLAAHGRMSNSFVVDHIQPRSFPSVLGYHFANGRASGATLRAHARQSGRHPVQLCAAHLAHVLVVRPWRGWQCVRQHPQRRDLPRGTALRWPLLMLSHACGTVAGFVAGAGQSMWQLE